MPPGVLRAYGEPAGQKEDPAGGGTGTDQAVREALGEADEEDVILAFGSLSYLEQVKEAVDKEMADQEKKEWMPVGQDAGRAGRFLEMPAQKRGMGK